MVKGELALDLHDLQRAVLAPRPSSYVGCYLVLRIDHAHDGRELLRRLTPYVTTAAGAAVTSSDASINLALSYQGLQALGVPQTSLESFPKAFREGMAARAECTLGDKDESAPSNWEKPFGTPDVHLAISLVAPTAAKLDEAITTARQSCNNLAGISLIYRLDAAQLSSGRTHFGYQDGISQPLTERTSLLGYPGEGPLLNVSRLLLGHADETGRISSMPIPSALGSNGTFMVFRKLHERVALFRQFLRSNSASQSSENLLAAKIVGRWRSGAPLALCPNLDDPALGTDPQRNNNFNYADDPLGLKCPRGAHVRRANPRDSLADSPLTDVTLHRCLRRGTSYGPALAEDALEDDGVDRGIVFIFLGSSIERQYEFVRSQWQNDGDFIGLGTEKDPLVGANDGTSPYTIPQRPIRRRLQNVPRFTVTRGGEYCFVPSLTAIRWLASLE